MGRWSAAARNCACLFIGLFDYTCIFITIILIEKCLEHNLRNLHVELGLIGLLHRNLENTQENTGGFLAIVLYDI